MANFSYNSSGATPPVPRPTMGGMANTSSSPFSSALNNAANPAFGKGLSVASGGNVVSLPPIPAPSTPVKKTTVNNVDGSSHVTEYHAPITQGTTPGIMGPQNGTPPSTTDSQTQNSPTPPVNPGLVTTPTLPSAIDATGAAAQSAFNQGNAEQSQAFNRAEALRNDLTQSQLNEAKSLADVGNSPIPLEFQQGRAGVLQGQYAAQQAGYGAGLQGESNLAGIGNASQGQGITGLGTTAGLLTPGQQFTQVPYSNQVIGSDGKPVGGGTIGTLPQSAQDAINLQIQRVKSGLSTIGDAQSAISAYGQAGVNALQEGLGSGFNVNASNASAGTTATGQQIQTAADSTNKALDTLSSAFTGLPAFQTGGIPATNSIAQWVGTALGDSALQQYKTSLADARSQLIGVLNSVGGTPTGNEATANQYLPDNMTVDQFKQNVGTAQNPGIVRQLIAQKVVAFTSSGQQNTNSNPSSAKEGESTSAGGYNFTYKNGQWVAQ